jgi:hypothetical protein
MRANRAADRCRWCGRDEVNTMTRTTAARLGGFTFLFYIAVGIGSMAMGLHGLARTLATAAQNGSAIVLALTLYIVTQAENRLLATLGMLLRLGEGLLGPITTVAGITLARPTLIDATLFAMGSLSFAGCCSVAA